MFARQMAGDYIERFSLTSPRQGERAGFESLKVLGVPCDAAHVTSR